MGLDAFFLPLDSGQRFCLLYLPEPGMPRRGAIVYVHPFAEELNKSRRMAALQARALVAEGYAVLQIDLLGCGDSSGDFGDASWERWIGDVYVACDWLRQRCEGDFWLWGLRSGCLLAGEVAAGLSQPVNLLLWQPVVSGKQYLQQFLRLKLASEMLGNESKGVMERLRQKIAQGEAIEIAGYRVSPELALGLERAVLVPPVLPSRIEWFELADKADRGFSPSANAQIDKFELAGHRVRGHLLTGQPFWQTAEISECAELIEVSVRALLEASTK